MFDPDLGKQAAKPKADPKLNPKSGGTVAVGASRFTSTSVREPPSPSEWSPPPKLSPSQEQEQLSLLSITDGPPYAYNYNADDYTAKVDSATGSVTYTRSPPTCTSNSDVVKSSSGSSKGLPLPLHLPVNKQLAFASSQDWQQPQVPPVSPHGQSPLGVWTVTKVIKLGGDDRGIRDAADAGGMGAVQQQHHQQPRMQQRAGIPLARAQPIQTTDLQKALNFDHS